MNELTWKEPPKPTGRTPGNGRKYAAQAEALRSHPGQSLLLEEFPVARGVRARAVANEIRNGRYPAFRPGGTFEAQTATEKNNKGEDVVNVYAWFVGPDGG